MKESNTEATQDCIINFDGHQNEAHGLVPQANGSNALPKADVSNALPQANVGNVLPPSNAGNSPAQATSLHCLQRLRNAPANRGSRAKEKPVLQFRSDARIWHLYLEDAEREAKDRMELWKTSLDSLLIFAGLFAGVVASFLIDARHDLQEDSEQNLLGDIRDYLRFKGMSVSDVVNIPVSQKGINALWLLSLYITLFSVIMGVLAKAWLAIFVPFTTRREAEAAYNRYRLDKQAKRWYLEEVITLVPFLVQMAAFLFLSGLIIQSSADNRTLGWVLLGFCLAGCVIYIIMTILPLFSSSPFNTPLSALLLWFRELFTALFARILCHTPPPSSDSEFAEKDDINGGLAEVLYHNLIKSPKSTHVDEAAAEIALPSFHHDWIEYLCQRDAPQYLLERFRRCALTRTNNVVKRDAILCNHLLAFLRIMDHLEEQIALNLWDTMPPPKYNLLRTALEKSLESRESPLNRWNSLPESLRPLLFGLRMQVLSTPLLGRLSSAQPLVKRDFHFDEISDRPWELAFQDIISDHRLHFMLAACRGVLQGEENLKTTSTFILGLSLAKAGWTALETGRTSEWDGRIDKRDRLVINKLMQKLLSKLYTALMDELDGRVAIASNDAPPPQDSEVIEVVPERQGLLKTLDSSLINSGLWFHSIKMLNQALLQGHRLFEHITESTIVTISNMVVYNDERARTDGLNILANVHVKASSVSKLQAAVARALLASVGSGLNHKSRQQFLNTIEFIRTLWGDPKHPLCFLIKQFIPSLINAVLSPYACWPALRLAEDIWTCNKAHLHWETRDEIPRALHAGLKSAVQSRSSCILADLTGLLEDDGPKLPPYSFLWDGPGDMVQQVFPVVFDEIVTVAIQDHPLHEMAQNLLKQLVKYGATIKADVLHRLIAASVLGEKVVFANAVVVVGCFIEQLDFSEALLKMLLDWACGIDEDDVRSLCVGLSSTICEAHISIPALRNVVEKTILSVSDGIVREPASSIRYLWVRLLSNILKYGSFPEAVSIILKLHMTMDYDSELRESGRACKDFLVLGESENNSAYTEALESAFPENFSVSLQDPSSQDWPTTAKWIKLLGALPQTPSLRARVSQVLEGIVTDVKDGTEAKPASELVEPDSDGAMAYMSPSTLKLPLWQRLAKIRWADRRNLVDILEIVGAHSLSSSEDAHTILFEIAKHDIDPGVRCACLKSLNQLAKHCNLSDEVLKQLSSRAISDPDDSCRSEAVITFLNLLEIEDGDRDPSPKERYRATVKAMVEDGFCNGIKERRWELRRSWIELVGTQIENAGFPYLAELFDAAVKDLDHGVQAEAMIVIRRLLQDAQLGAPIAAKLGKALDSLIKVPKHTDRIVTVLTTIHRGSRERLQQLWAQIAVLLSHWQNRPYHSSWLLHGSKDSDRGSQTLSNLIEAAIKEETSDTIFKSQDALYSFFQSFSLNVELPKSIDGILPLAIESNLGLDAMPNVRLFAVKVVGTLIGCIPGRAGTQIRYERLLRPDCTSQIISRLADIVIKDEDETLRNTALRVLKLAYNHRDLFAFVKASLSKIIQDSLKDYNARRDRHIAVSTVDSLTEENTNEQYRDIVSPSISQLLRIVLIEGDEELRASVSTVLFQNFTVSPVETKLNRDVFVAIPPLAAIITTVAGKAALMKLAEELAISDDTAFHIACDLTPMLKSTSSFARATVIEFLLKLYTKHQHSKPQLIDSAVPDIISLAFDEKDDVGGIRITAIQFLVALSSKPSTLKSITEGQPESFSVLKQITLLATRFMGLLQDDHLRPSVVELLSLISLDDTARETITLRIASMAFGPETPALVGHVELLARLISDGRLGEKATDFMMLFLAPVLVNRPQLTHFKFEILTALWCRYSRKTLWANDDAPGKLEELKKDIQEGRKGDIGKKQQEDATQGNQIEDTGKGQEGLGDEKEPKKDIQEGSRGDIEGIEKGDVKGGQKIPAADREFKAKQREKLVEWFALALFGRHVRSHEAQTWTKRCKRYLETEKRSPAPETQAGGGEDLAGQS